jgi:hypothetical protein
MWWAFFIGPSQKNNNQALNNPKNKYIVMSSFWAAYIGCKSRIQGKGYEIKWGAIENILGEHIGN